MNKRILLTGGSGQLGKELKKLRKYIAPTHKDMDITSKKSVASYLKKIKPSLILHAAAYTDTLKPEDDPVEAYKCYVTNVIGTRNIVQNAKCPIVYISTENALEPYNFYIITKLGGENEIKRHHSYQILRTSFRSIPFEYEKACTDMLTIADSVDIIAKLINKAVDLPCKNKIVYIGTSIKTVFELAKKTRPNVISIKRSDLLPNHVLPAMKTLKKIKLLDL